MQQPYQHGLYYPTLYASLMFFRNSREHRKSSAELNAIIVLVIITVAFIFLQVINIPTPHNNMMFTLWSEHKLMVVFIQVPELAVHVLWRTDMSVAPTFTIFSDELSILNSSINFIIYSATSSYFRKRLSKVCCHLSLLLPGYYEVWRLSIRLYLCRCLRMLRIGSIHLWTNPQEGQRTGQSRVLTNRDKILHQPRLPEALSCFSCIFFLHFQQIWYLSILLVFVIFLHLMTLRVFCSCINSPNPMDFIG